MATNKRKDLGIGTFLDEVKADQTSTQRISAPETEPEPAVQQAEAPYYGNMGNRPQGMPYPSGTSCKEAVAVEQEARQACLYRR